MPEEKDEALRRDIQTLFDLANSDQVTRDELKQSVTHLHTMLKKLAEDVFEVRQKLKMK